MDIIKVVLRFSVTLVPLSLSKPIPFGARLDTGGVFDPGNGIVGAPLVFGFPPGVSGVGVGVGLGPLLLQKLKKCKLIKYNNQVCFINKFKINYVNPKVAYNYPSTS